VTVKVKVKDFQSIEDAEIEVSGFTVVTGQNNGGKSALMRAVRGVFQNTKGSAYVRHGKAKSMVDIDLNGEHSVYWEKGLKSKPIYIVDNGKVIHPGQAVPSEVSDLGIHSIQAGNRDIWPQFAPQFTGQIFLLDQPGSVLAEAVADVDRVSQLNQALRLSESDRRAANAELKIRRVDKENLERDLERFEGMGDAIVFVETLEASVVTIRRIEKALTGIYELRDQYVSAIAAVARLKGIENVDVPPTEQLDSMAHVLNEISEVSTLHDRFTDISSEVTRLKGVEKIKLPEDKKLDALAGILETVAEVKALRNRYVKSFREVSLLEGVESITLDDMDMSLGERMLTAIDMVKGLYTRYTSVAGNITQLEADVVDAEKEAVDTEAAVADYLKELGQCPVCDSAITG